MKILLICFRNAPKLSFVEWNKYLDEISEEAIVGVNIPTGIPLVYELDADLRPTSSRYLGDPERAAAAAAAVAAQGAAKRP